MFGNSARVPARAHTAGRTRRSARFGAQASRHLSTIVNNGVITKRLQLILAHRTHAARRGAASSVGVQDISHIFCCSSFGSQPTTSITTAEDFDEKHSNMARSSSENISKLLGTYCVGTAKLIIRSHSHSIKSSTSSSFCYESHSK